MTYRARCEGRKRRQRWVKYRTALRWYFESEERTSRLLARASRPVTSVADLVERETLLAAIRLERAVFGAPHPGPFAGDWLPRGALAAPYPEDEAKAEPIPWLSVRS